MADALSDNQTTLPKVQRQQSTTKKVIKTLLNKQYIVPAG